MTKPPCKESLMVETLLLHYCGTSGANLADVLASGRGLGQIGFEIPEVADYCKEEGINGKRFTAFVNRIRDKHIHTIADANATEKQYENGEGDEDAVEGDGLRKRGHKGEDYDDTDSLYGNSSKDINVYSENLDSKPSAVSTRRIVRAKSPKRNALEGHQFIQSPARSPVLSHARSSVRPLVLQDNAVASINNGMNQVTLDVPPVLSVNQLVGDNLSPRGKNLIEDPDTFRRVAHAALVAANGDRTALLVYATELEGLKEADIKRLEHVIKEEDRKLEEFEKAQKEACKRLREDLRDVQSDMSDLIRRDEKLGRDIGETRLKLADLELKLDDLELQRANLRDELTDKAQAEADIKFRIYISGETIARLREAKKKTVGGVRAISYLLKNGYKLLTTIVYTRRFDEESADSLQHMNLVTLKNQAVGENEANVSGEDRGWEAFKTIIDTFNSKVQGRKKPKTDG